MKRLALAAALVLLGIGGLTVASQRSATAMAGAANKWLTSLTPEQRQQAVFAFDSDERLKWHFIPNESFPRNGLTFKEMTEPQRAFAADLLKTGLSARGYLTATLDHGARECPARDRGRRSASRAIHEVYRVSRLRHAWRQGGVGLAARGASHLGPLRRRRRQRHGELAGVLRLESRGSPSTARRRARASSARKKTPPARSSTRSTRRSGPRRSSPPRRRATSSTMILPKVDPLSPPGIKATALTQAAARETDAADRRLRRPDGARRRRRADGAAAKAGLDNITFAWAGETAKGKKHYYRIQGPTFLVEYDNTQNDGNHIHSVWRDFNGDFGRDLLREHLKSQPH